MSIPWINLRWSATPILCSTGRLRAGTALPWRQPWLQSKQHISSCRTRYQLAVTEQRSVRGGQASDDDDPGAWDYSPEWMGSQGCGWGRDEGVEVFAAESRHGNGTISVTAHVALRQDPPPGASAPGAAGGAARQEWRTLRFNQATRQSVAKVWVLEAHGSAAVHAEAKCLGMEYLKTMASAAAAALGCAGVAARACGGAGSPPSGGAALSAVCVGVGGGSLPHFLARAFPGMRIEAVELDPVVLQAATSAMGLPLDRQNLHVVIRDGVAFMAERARAVSGGAKPPVDFVFLDVFDGADDIPLAFTTPGGEFLEVLAAALHPTHGTLIANMHSGARPNLGAALLRRLRGEPAMHIDWESVEGQEVLRVSRLYREALAGTAFVIGADKQCNAAVVVSRGMHALQHDRESAAEQLSGWAAAVGSRAGFPFDAGRRAGLSVHVP